MIKLERFSDRILGPLLKDGLSLIKNVVKSLAKVVLIPLGLTAAASATNTIRVNSSSISNKCRYSKECFYVWHNSISNQKMDELMKNLAAERYRFENN